jgi:hypothetical protein
MRFFELTHRGFGECGPAPSGVPGERAVLAGLQPRRSGVVGGPAVKLTQLSKTLHVYLSITTKATSDGDFPVARQIQKAKDVLALHGLTLALEFESSGFADTINFPYSLVLDDDVAQLRKASEATRAGSENVMRIIACPRSVNAPMGETFRGVTAGGKPFPPFAVLNSNAVAADGATLIHEMIHAAHSGRCRTTARRTACFLESRKPARGPWSERCSSQIARSRFRRRSSLPSSARSSA